MNQKLAEARILAARKMPYMTHQVMTLTEGDSGCDRWLHRLASRAGGATSCGLPHAKRSGQCGAEVD
jgi:hypothetical protein